MLLSFISSTTISFYSRRSEAMTLQMRTLAFSLCCLLASASHAWAAGKHKSGRGHGRWSTPSRDKNHESSGAAGSDTTSSKTGAGSTQPRSAESRTTSRESVQRESRIEFDERMLKGQSAAGVIYLFQRTPSDWKSIVEVPDSFRAHTTSVLAPAEEKK
jgi:hypothetical protein